MIKPYYRYITYIRLTFYSLIIFVTAFLQCNDRNVFYIQAVTNMTKKNDITGRVVEQCQIKRMGCQNLKIVNWQYIFSVKKQIAIMGSSTLEKKLLVKVKEKDGLATII